MATLTDAKFDALRAQGFTGSISDMTLQWLQANGATSPSIPDAWREMLVTQGYDPYQRNDAWFALLGDAGYAGQINDREMQFWVNGGTLARYTFNGIDQYVSIPTWDTLGDYDTYGAVTFTFSGTTDGIIDLPPPVDEFGRVGAVYHDGTLSNMRLTDNSPIQNTSVKTASTGTLPAIQINDATISFDYIVHSADEVILDGLISLVSGVLVTEASVIDVLVDGGPYVDAPLTAGQHITVEFFANTAGALSSLSALSGMQNLNISTVEYI